MTSHISLSYRLFRSLIASIALIGAAAAAAQSPPAAVPAPQPQSVVALPAPNRQTSISLTPAVIMARGQFGQTLTQTLTMTNDTPREFAFEMVASDVVVRDGKREFVPAGNLENSIALSAVFSQKTGVIKSHASGSVDVRLTLPKETVIRAVVVVFKGTETMTPSHGSVGMTASLGTLVTFNITDEVKVDAEPVKASLDSEMTGASVEEALSNSGREPAMVGGVAAILNAEGKLMGKAPFPNQRLLPGERLKFATEYGGQLPKGAYKVLCSFEFEGKQLTNSGALQIR